MKILLLGDGNFSFSLALAQFIAQDNPFCYSYLNCTSLDSVQLVATSFDSREKVIYKYQDSKDILLKLSKFQFVKVLHGINAWQLDQHFDCKFDLVGWNHPHLGTEDFRLHKFLMCHFFDSVSKVLEREGTVCVSVVEGQDDRWELEAQAQRVGFKKSSLQPFNETDWPGYQAKRNKNGKSFKNSHTLEHVGHSMKSRLWQFTKGASSNIESNTNSYKVEEITEIIEKELVIREFKCLECSRCLKTERGLQNHIHTVHRLQLFGDWSTFKSIKCDHCDRLFSSEYDRWQHSIHRHSRLSSGELTVMQPEQSISTTEESLEFYPCPTCGQAVVKAEWGMLLHLESLKPLIGMDMKCPKCQVKCIEQRALFQHYKFCRVKLEKNRRIRYKKQQLNGADTRMSCIKLHSTIN